MWTAALVLGLRHAVFGRADTHDLVLGWRPLVSERAHLDALAAFTEHEACVGVLSEEFTLFMVAEDRLVATLWGARCADEARRARATRELRAWYADVVGGMLRVDLI